MNQLVTRWFLRMPARGWLIAIEIPKACPSRQIGSLAEAGSANGMIGILLTQRMMDSPEPPPVFTDFWTLAYAAMA